MKHHLVRIFHPPSPRKAHAPSIFVFPSPMCWNPEPSSQPSAPELHRLIEGARHQHLCKGVPVEAALVGWSPTSDVQGGLILATCVPVDLHMMQPHTSPNSREQLNPTEPRLKPRHNQSSTSKLLTKPQPSTHTAQLSYLAALAPRLLAGPSLLPAPSAPFCPASVPSCAPPSGGTAAAAPAAQCAARRWPLVRTKPPPPGRTLSLWKRAKKNARCVWRSSAPGPTARKKIGDTNTKMNDEKGHQLFIRR